MSHQVIDSTRAASERFVDGEWKQLTHNPLNGGWEYLSRRQWRMLKLGIPKENHHLIKDDWQLSMLEGPESAIKYAFDLNSDEHEATIRWLVVLSKEFKIKTPQQLYSWADWITDIYPLHKLHAPLNRAMKDVETKKKIAELRKCLLTSLKEESESFAVRSRKQTKKR